MLLLATKGYGFTIEQIDWSCPNEMQPYIDAYNLQEKIDDRKMWLMGIYVQRAVCVAVEANLAGNQAKGKYFEKPILDEADRKKHEPTEEEIKKEVDEFYANSAAMRMSWKFNH